MVKKKSKKKVLVLSPKKRSKKGTEETHESSIELLRGLMNDPGWLILNKALDKEIMVIERKLFGELELGFGETIKSLQDQRDDRIGLKDMPKNLIDKFQDKGDLPIELDPYDKPEPEELED